MSWPVPNIEFALRHAEACNSEKTTIFSVSPRLSPQKSVDGSLDFYVFCISNLVQHFCIKIFFPPTLFQKGYTGSFAHLNYSRDALLNMATTVATYQTFVQRLLNEYPD